MLAGLFMSAKYTPAMSVRPVRPSVAHRSATLETGFVPSPLMWSEIFAMKRKYKRKLYKKIFKKIIIKDIVFVLLYQTLIDKLLVYFGKIFLAPITPALFDCSMLKE